jgi:hypothetical protein
MLRYHGSCIARFDLRARWSGVERQRQHQRGGEHADRMCIL